MSQELSLRANFARDTDRLALTAVRAIVVAASDPKVKLNVEGLSKATGLEPVVINEMLASPEYRNMLQDTCKSRIATLMQRSITVLEGLMESESDRTKLEAVGKATTLYAALNRDAVHIDTVGKASADELLKKLEAMQAIRRIKVEPEPPKDHGNPTE